ncbi:MAG TPA: glycoside hydrolase family 3 N-terminal domain-containing protein [Bacteroidota bacterium]|nr:glycoside hydrolase family 3 N-terminal domain-containing protein [Bacteroidota bacterium]
MRHTSFAIPALAAILLLVVFLNGCGSSGTNEASNWGARQEWIESTLKRLSLEERIGQMIMSRAYGYYYSSESDEYRRLVHIVKDHKFGGLVFFQGDVYETATMVNDMQGLADVPLLVGSDFEWGSAMRIRRSTRFPEAMAVGATRDTAFAYGMGKIIGEESRAIGVLQAFAPVADVNVNPENPVINTRSFGENPKLVSDMATAFVSGIQAEGVLATAKHFPGHGDTQVDSHLDLPIIRVTRPRMDSVELAPYRSMFQRGLASVMVAHVEVPSIDPRPLPSTLSSAIISNLLQRELGFHGLIVTDAMEMGALNNTFGPDSAAVKAIQAGVDILLTLPDEDGAVEAIAAAVTSGRISRERIDYSVRKILGVKWDLGLVQHRLVDIKNIPTSVATRDHLSFAKQIAREAITVLKNDNVLPLPHSGNKRILNIIVSDLENYRTEINRTTSPYASEPVGDYFISQIRRRYANIETVRLDPSSDSLNFRLAMIKAKRADILLCPVFNRARSGAGKFGLSDELIVFMNQLLAAGKPSVVIAMGSPYVLGTLPNASAYLCSYSDAEIITEATAEVLFGEIPAKGKLPVTIPNTFEYGRGIDLEQSVLRKDSPENSGFDGERITQIDTIMNNAIADHAFPGGQALVVRNGAIAYNKSFGHQEYFPGSPAIDNMTMYDLASVTKVIATTSGIMKLYEEGKLKLDDLVTSYIPEFANHGKEKIRLYNLLVHNAGLPPFKRLFLTTTSSQEVLDSVYQTEMVYKTGDSTLYSDFDFILLGKIIERITGRTLDRYVDSVFFAPLGLTRTMFKPDSSLWKNTAPTEYDSLYRHRLVRGVVHDENADALGGVSGHAGLFSNASDLAVYMQMIMNGGTYAGRRYLKPETINMFTRKQGAGSSRALGWDTKSATGYSSAGALFSRDSFGHTGFTGTSIWVDPERKIFLILLTNRVYPTRNDSKIAPIRAAVADAVIKALKN